MKKIQLGGHVKRSKVRGFAIVDDEDFEKVNKYEWCMAKCSGTNFYAIGKIKERNKYFFMHRFILDVPKGKQVDHINGDGLDNRRKNIRICTYSENAMNRKIGINNTSGYKGVTWDKERNLWRVQIMFNQKWLRLGRFSEKKKAAKKYNEIAKKLFGSFAKLNKI